MNFLYSFINKCVYFVKINFNSSLFPSYNSLIKFNLNCVCVKLGGLINGNYTGAYKNTLKDLLVNVFDIDVYSVSVISILLNISSLILLNRVFNNYF